MTDRYGRQRKRRRKVRFGGWVSSMGAAGVAGALMCSHSPEQCVVGLLVVFFTAGVWHPWMKREGGVPVLIFHSVSDDAAWLPWSPGISVSPELFSRNLASLRSMGCTVIRTAELVAARKTGRPLGRRPVVIQFDDGYLDNWVAALPVLKRFNMPATVFVSVDFIESGNKLRPTLDDVDAGRVDAADLKWDGYLNWAELRAMQESGLIDIQAHGVSHGRVPTGPETVGILNEENWQQHAWLQWQHMPGNKSEWYRDRNPPYVPLGTEVPQSGSALAVRSWSAQGIESEHAYEKRVSAELCTAKTALEKGLGRPVSFFCWPFNETNARAHALALEAGYVATTGGEGENRDSEDPSLISRYHVGAGALGRPNIVLDNFVFRVRVRLFQGNYYWGILIIPLIAVQRMFRIFFPSFAGSGA